MSAAIAPDVPTVAEVAVPGFNFPIWGGLFAPSGMPRDIVALLNREINQIYLRPEVQARMESEQSEIEQNSPEQFGAFVEAESEKYRLILKEVGPKWKGANLVLWSQRAGSGSRFGMKWRSENEWQEHRDC